MGKKAKTGGTVDEGTGNMLMTMMTQVEDLDFGGEGENDPKRLLVEGFQVSRLFAIVDFALSQADVAEGILSGMDLISREKAIKAINGTFLIEAVGEGNKVQQFYVDMKKEGKISLGPGPAKPKPEVVIRVADRDMIALATGKITPQVAFMRGKIKVRGNIMKGLQMQNVMNRETSKLSKL
ncbi:unnamed protein product [Tilletia controversa]|uniref:SCP2 domain-containing protein n=3 Tax=Tilletia TaxID=13289 RepID=A0A8X7MR79_9BASI|nr:hypothetical protein CF336_g4712 [Tilletia laevis]KAE8195800.1 hypothetical protein CF328_g4324 [Tilletia controversa]KAE8259664.1 hypothetical protein A4X03_0g4036 [Tilletia caries]KAE8200820.1 hypothetical protein CF335_g3874 [Tilletia laevis]KAE8246399.1 hypothetical protein A4X06_0g5032 [Tilletia controversa]